MPDNTKAHSLLMPDRTSNREGALKETPTVYGSVEPGAAAGDIDISLLEESLRLSPWERMLANDDALNFGASLCAAMERRNAKP
jgi:hypothetical protein